MIDKIAQIAYSYRETVFHTYGAAVACMPLDGCFVECGVGAGAQIAAMQLANFDFKKEIFGFDSFQGIPIGCAYDEVQPGTGDKLTGKGELVSSGVTVHSKKDVQNNFRQLGISLKNVFLIEGWFQDTVKDFSKPIALLRLDGDLYESTMVCLKYLYPLVVEGGVIIVDDYTLPGCRRAIDEYFNHKLILHKLEPEQNGVHWFYK